MPKQPNLDRLRAQLSATGLKDREPALYQVIDQLIQFVRQSRDSTLEVIGGGTSGGGGLAQNSLSFLTTNPEATLSNSRRVMAGSNVTFDDSVPGIRTISAGSSGPLGTQWSVLTAGAAPEPEFVFADNEVVMLHIP